VSENYFKLNSSILIQKRTPLHVAVTSVRNSTVPKLLLNGGADINRWDLNKKTPLHHFFDETIHEILLDSEIDSGIDCKDDRGMTIVHYVAWSSRSTRGDLSRALLKGCVSLTERDDTNRSALHLASQRGNLDIMAFLLASDHGAELASCDAHGRTPLHYATESHRAGTAIDMLLEYGLQIHHRDGNGCTVLHHAAARGKTEAVKKLLQVGAETDLHVCDQEGRTPMQIAAAWGAVPTTEYLRPIYLNAARGVLSVPPDNERKGPANVRQTSTYLYGQLFSCLVLLISMLVWIVGYG
jgi:ankyrin repeat protein